MRDVCADTYTVSLLWNTCENKARGQAQETKEAWGLKEGLYIHKHSHEQIPAPRKLEAYRVTHIHTIMCMLIKTFPTRTPHIRTKNKPDIMSPTPMMAF